MPDRADHILVHDHTRPLTLVHGACTAGEWTDWAPACPGPCGIETQTLTCESDPRVEQERTRTTNLVGGACVADEWSEWAPDCPASQECLDASYSWRTTSLLWLEIDYAARRLRTLGYTPRRIPNNLAFARGFDCKVTRAHLGGNNWGPQVTECDIRREITEAVPLSVQIPGLGMFYEPIWVLWNTLVTDDSQVILNYSTPQTPITRTCSCMETSSIPITYVPASDADLLTVVPDGPWVEWLNLCF